MSEGPSVEQRRQQQATIGLEELAAAVRANQESSDVISARSALHREINKILEGNSTSNNNSNNNGQGTP